MSNEMAVLGSALSQVTTTVGDESEFKKSTKTRFLGRIQFYAKGKSFGDDGHIAPGHYGVPLSNGKIEDLGKEIDVLPIAKRMKAMDMNDLEKVQVTCDTASAEYKRIAEAFDAGHKNYLCGPSFLVVERHTGLPYELYCGSNTLQEPANLLQGYCPLSQADCRAKQIDVANARDAAPATLGSRKVESKKYKSSWFVATVEDCLTPFTRLPDVGSLIAEIERFKKPPAGAMQADEAEVNDRAR